MHRARVGRHPQIQGMYAAKLNAHKASSFVFITVAFRFGKVPEVEKLFRALCVPSTHMTAAAVLPLYEGNGSENMERIMNAAVGQAKAAEIATF